MDVEVDIKIDNLCAFPRWIPQIAEWHHEEWTKGLPEKVYLEQQKQVLLNRDINEREHSLRAHLEAPCVPSTLIAHTLNVPVGSVSLVNYQFSRDQKPSQWLTNLYVVEQYRRRGLGTRLISCALDFAVENNLQQLYLYTRDLTDFYRARGWVFSHQGTVQGRTVDVLKITLSHRGN